MNSVMIKIKKVRNKTGSEWGAVGQKPTGREKKAGGEWRKAPERKGVGKKESINNGFQSIF